MSDNKIVPLSQFLNEEKMQQSIKNTLKEGTADFIASVIAISNANAKLANCERKSLVNACLTAIVLRLPINQNLGYAWIIPYENRKTKTTEAQFQMGWKGFVQLAMRTGRYSRINVREVKEGEFLGEDFVSGDIQFQWLTENRDKAKTVGYFAFFRLKDGFEKISYMTVEQINIHAGRYSKAMASGYGPWKEEYDAMAKKTVLKLLISKYGPMSTELAKAIADDQAVIGEEKTTYVDNQKLSAQETAEDKEKQRLIKYINNCRSIASLEKCRSSIDNYPDVIELYEAKEAKLKEKTNSVKVGVDVAQGESKTVETTIENGQVTNTQEVKTE